MAEASDTIAKCNGLDIPVLGCLDTGYWGLDVILALASSLFTFWMLLLGGEKWRERIREAIYDASWSTAYAGLLENLGDRLDRFFGRPWSRRALDMCFRLAVIYAFVYMFFADMMSSSVPPPEKWISTGVFLVVGSTLFLIARQVRRRHLLARRGSEHRRRRLWLHLREQLTYFALVFVIDVGAVAVAVAVARAEVAGGLAAFFVVVVAQAGTVVGAGTVAVAGAVVGKVAGSVALVVAVTGALAQAGALAVATSLSATLIFIPCLNALFDWPSWAASRWLMRRLEEDVTLPGFLRRAGALLGHIAIDGAIAIACLFGLAIVLINFTHAIDVPDIWNETLNAAKEAPFSAGGSVMTVMLLSTLVPTALHLFFALFALAAIQPPYREWFKGWLKKSKGGGEWGNRAIVSAHLTFWMVFALVVLWGAAMVLLRGLDGLWLRIGWGFASDPYPFWASIFRAAEAFVIF